MKLFLTSAGFDNENLIPPFLKLLGKPVDGLKVLFIPTALNTEKAREYIPVFKEDLYKLGIEDSAIVSVELDSELPADIEHSMDLIFVCPGDPEYLLAKLKSSGFLPRLKSMIEKDIPYIGLSAGSDILAANLPDGLNLTGCILECHAEQGSPDGAVQAESGTIRLRDDQALMVTDDGVKIIC